ncbi:MAG TPA: FHA domain-containing protein [Thermoanaerobacterales bacterium]|nr:FHA domain-containing protein [Thermoanaerobacterales bacterium]
MYGLFVQLAKFIFIGLIYYFLFNFLKLMFMDIANDGKSTDIGYFLLADDGTKYPLSSINSIGRASDSDIVIDDPFISSKHVLITKKGRKIIVQDLHSTNGVFVNGKRIKKPVSIKNKDEIVIGNTKLTLLRREAGGVKNPSYL